MATLGPYSPSQMSAISSALAAGNNTVLLTAGTFTLNKPSSRNYVWSIGSNTTLRGVGDATVIKMGSARGYPDVPVSGMILCNGSETTDRSESSYKYNILIENIHFTGNNTGSVNTTTDILLVFNYTHHVEIRNCLFDYTTGDFIKFRESHDCSVHDNRMHYSGHECVYMLGNNYNMGMYNNTCTIRKNGAFRGGYSCHDIWIHHNTIAGTGTGPGIELDKGKIYNIAIYENTFTDVHAAAVWAFSGSNGTVSKNLLIYNNTFIRCGSKADDFRRGVIVTYQISQVKIYNNRFVSNAGYYGLYVTPRYTVPNVNSKYTISFTNNFGNSTASFIVENNEHFDNSHIITTSNNVVGSGGGAGSGTVTPPPVVVDNTQPSVKLVANSPSLIRGNSTSLAWTTTNCTSAILNTYINDVLTSGYQLPLGSGVTSTGSYPITPTATSVYKIFGYYTKVSPTREASASAQVTVTDPVVLTPSITSLTVSKTTVYTNEMVVINVVGAKNYTSAIVDIETNVGQITPNDITTHLNDHSGDCALNTAFSSAGTKSIILTLKNGNIVKTFAPQTPITVINAPTPIKPSLTLTASFTEIIYGDEISLNWVCSNATALIVNGVPQSSKNISAGALPVSPGSAESDQSIVRTYTYEAVATNTSYGVTSSTTQSVVITVNPYIPRVPLVRLRTDRQIIDIDQPAVISWFAENTNTLTVNNGIGEVDHISGSISVYPTVQTTYVFSAEGDDGANNTSITIDVLAEDILSQFVFTPETVYPGDPVTLAWASRFGKYGSIDNDIGSVNPAAGTYVVYPSADTDYTFTVSGSMGVSTKTVSIPITEALASGSPRAKYTVDRPLITSGELSTISWITENAEVMACGQDIGFVEIPSGSIPVTPYYTENYEFIVANDTDSVVYDVPIYVIGDDYEIMRVAVPTYVQDYIDITGRRVYVSGGQSTSDTQYTWDIDTNASIRPNPSDEMITFAYNENGYYMITLTSVDRNGDVIKQTVRANVINE